MPELVPVTVIAGYLGAGKTTLINALLRGDHGRRLAVLVNDYGSVNLDADLIEEHRGQTISLTNGCICCSIADSLADSLDEVLALDPPPDQIVIEASGVADPGTVAGYGHGWPGCRLDAVVVLADAETIRTQATDQFVGELVTRQLSRADVVVLSKSDLVTSDVLESTVEWVRGYTSAVVVPASDGLVDPQLVLDLRIESFTRSDSMPTLQADDLFTASIVDVAQPIADEELRRLLDAMSSDVVRVKGVVLVQSSTGQVARHVAQRVGRRCTVEPAPDAVAVSAGLITISIRRV